MANIVKCRYTNCLCDSKDVDKEDAVQVGKQYFHKECYKTKTEIQEIVKLFSEKINKNVIYSQLNSVIKNIVFTKKLGSEFLLYGLKYYINHKIPLNYPQGLYYVIQNKDVIKTYNDLTVKEMKKSFYIEEDKDNGFKYIPNKSKGFGDIIS